MEHQQDADQAPRDQSRVANAWLSYVRNDDPQAIRGRTGIARQGNVTIPAWVREVGLGLAIDRGAMRAFDQIAYEMECRLARGANPEEARGCFDGMNTVHRTPDDPVPRRPLERVCANSGREHWKAPRPSHFQGPEPPRGYPCRSPEAVVAKLAELGADKYLPASDGRTLQSHLAQHRLEEAFEAGQVRHQVLERYHGTGSGAAGHYVLDAAMDYPELGAASEEHWKGPSEFPGAVQMHALAVAIDAGAYRTADRLMDEHAKSMNVNEAGPGTDPDRMLLPLERVAVTVLEPSAPRDPDEDEQSRRRTGLPASRTSHELARRLIACGADPERIGAFGQSVRATLEQHDAGFAVAVAEARGEGVFAGPSGTASSAWAKRAGQDPGRQDPGTARSRGAER